MTKMKVLTTMLMSLLLVMSAVFVAADNVVPVQIEGLEIDDIDIEPFGVNILDLERDDEFELEFKLMSVITRIPA